MTGIRAYVCGIGIVTPLGSGTAETLEALAGDRIALRPLELFPTPDNRPLPVGEVRMDGADRFPRTHALSMIAADQAMAGCRKAPDAVVVGTTTGGMFTTERLLKEGIADPDAYRFHGAGTVADMLARRYGCTGPVITVSTACSSGAVAIKLALELLRSGRAGRVLAGGADSLCRLTYYGFHSLQLIDPAGARPFDLHRRGMSVAEGAAMVLMASDGADTAVAEILGGGLSCDAFHPARPHPDGRGALAAMEAALRDAGISPEEIDYVSLHGTGTPDNDLAEARAVSGLFGSVSPLMSSVKGAMGHSLAAAGAVEAVLAGISISENRVPGNAGHTCVDPELDLTPTTASRTAPVRAVLSNSFGFGGNNASVVVSGPGLLGCPSTFRLRPMGVAGSACLTGAGWTENTFDHLSRGETCRGKLSDPEIVRSLPSGKVRRLKRLSRMALSLAAEARARAKGEPAPDAVFLGTGWGAVSETHDFFERLYETGERFPSPTDFVGSVHNAAAGQIAMHFGSMGANVTTTGGDYSFEQALTAAALLARDNPRAAIAIGVDEAHEVLSRRFDPSLAGETLLSDGGGALMLTPEAHEGEVAIDPTFFAGAQKDPDIPDALVRHLGGPGGVGSRFGVLLAGIPAAQRQMGEAQLERFVSRTDFRGVVIDYRRLTGEFAAASAVAAVAAVRIVADGAVPPALRGGGDGELNGKGALVIGLGRCVTLLEVTRR